MRHVFPLSYFTKTPEARLCYVILSISQLAPLGIILKLVLCLLVCSHCGVKCTFVHI